MLLDALLSRRLVVLTGKGGVGKSVVGAAIALAACERRRRVLLVEIKAPVAAAALFAGPGPARREPGPAGREAEVRPGLYTLNLDPAAVMDEYVRRVVKLEILARRVLESPVYHRFFAAAPGLKELMTLGKIMVLEEARARFSHRPLWDLIVLDAPATGHGLQFLKVPLAASAAVPVGPIGHNARRVLALLRDPAKTALVLVAVPEEMAVVEAVQFHRLAAEDMDMRPAAVVLNACHERRFSDDEEAEVLRLTAEGADGTLEPDVPLSAALRAARRQIRRRKLTRFYEARLRRNVDAPLVSLPFLFREALSLDDVRLLAGLLEAA
ncbi:MAG TPA: ArsA family ATPase [Vicinamibacteria bacterium]|nr:ArsA family ATPase [Vicinamibacteria bacterium]